MVPSWYGWSAQAELHWIMPIIGTVIYGFGLMTVLCVFSSVLAVNATSKLSGCS